MSAAQSSFPAKKEKWKETYQSRRYLQHCNHAELTERMDDILVNFYRFTADGRCVTFPYERNPWLRLLADVMFEVECRQLASATFDVKNLHLDSSRYPNVIKASSLWSRLGVRQGECLFKFGQLKYQQDLFDKGVLRIISASSYKEAFIPAIKDDELEVSQLVVKGRVVITDNEGVDREVETVGPCVITHSTPTDFYISSYAVLFESRLFDDFGADSCLIIRNVNEFEVRLKAAMEKSFPHSICLAGGVKYCDPYSPEREVDVYFAKHFRYQYQHELRFVWIPKVPQETLKPIFVELGCLSDICELVVL